MRLARAASSFFRGGFERAELGIVGRRRLIGGGARAAVVWALSLQGGAFYVQGSHTSTPVQRSGQVTDAPATDPPDGESGLARPAKGSRHAPVAANVRKANEKGRVERRIRSIRERFWPGRRFVDLLDLNRQAVAWRDDLANNREHEDTGRVPSLVFRNEERTLLKPLTATPFDADDVEPTTITKTSTTVPPSAEATTGTLDRLLELGAPRVAGRRRLPKRASCARASGATDRDGSAGPDQCAAMSRVMAAGRIVKDSSRSGKRAMYTFAVSFRTTLLSPPSKEGGKRSGTVELLDSILAGSVGAAPHPAAPPTGGPPHSTPRPVQRRRLGHREAADRRRSRPQGRPG